MVKRFKIWSVHQVEELKLRRDFCIYLSFASFFTMEDNEIGWGHDVSFEWLGGAKWTLADILPTNCPVVVPLLILLYHTILYYRT